MHHTQRWTVEKIERRLALIAPLVYRQRWPLPPFRLRWLASPGEEPPIAPDLDDSAWERLAPPARWGRNRADFALRTSFCLPADAPPTLALYLPLGDAGDFSHPECLVYVDGQPLAACDRHHQEIRLPAGYNDNQPHQLTLVGWTGMGGSWDNPPDQRLWAEPCAVVAIDQPARDFVVAARVALGVARHLESHDPARAHLLNALDAAFQRLDTREPFGPAFYASVAPAQALLHAGLAPAGDPLPVEIVAAGHAHIDVAWLWTLDQTRQKARRTFYTALHLMAEFPSYQFSQSQPQLYDDIRREDPALFAAIQAAVQQGRWEPMGGMWVEADCNLSGGESLARQFLLGRSFFRQHFGPQAESPVLWLPDVFGYAWNLPQLIKQAGLDYFFTIKIGWSQYNRMPYDSFWWQGLDGTRVLTHFSPTPEPGSAYGSTYNAAATPQDALGTWRSYKQKEQSQLMLMAYGYGDGGGGPTREMLENIAAMGQFPATPQVRPGRVGDFFRRLETTAGDRLPTWNGELYLEYHRGTYTTQGRNKRANRQAEFLLHDAEFLAALAAIYAPGYAYPQEALRQAWTLVCLNQFHDIIPGSSIGPVYDESQAQYAQVRALAAQVRSTALAALGAGGAVVNATSFALGGPVTVPGDWPGRAEWPPAGQQPTAEGVLLAAEPLPPYSLTPLASLRPQAPFTPVQAGLDPAAWLENGFLRVAFNPAGDIVQLYDRQNARDILPAGGVANQFQAFEDRPLAWDAWDIDIFYDDKQWLAEPATAIRLVEAGPLRATLEIRRRILGSDYSQRISLAYDSPRLDFDTHIDWRERHILLKVAFPVDILAPAATYEIQWGNVERPTHRNTSWDWARFETCAQKWVDLSEGDYGVSLLNNGKYGHDIQDVTAPGEPPYGRIRLSLLRSPTRPDPEADQGEHRFTYSLLPHAGRWGRATLAAAYALNDPAWTVSGVGEGVLATPAGESLVAADAAQVIIETIKGSEDGCGDVIVRLYESMRQRGPVTLRTAFPLAAAWRTNLLEENQVPLPHQDHAVSFTLKPYEIVTLRLRPA